MLGCTNHTLSNFPFSSFARENLQLAATSVGGPVEYFPTLGAVPLEYLSYLRVPLSLLFLGQLRLFLLQHALSILSPVLHLVNLVRVSSSITNLLEVCYRRSRIITQAGAINEQTTPSNSCVQSSPLKQHNFLEIEA